MGIIRLAQERDIQLLLQRLAWVLEIPVEGFSCLCKKLRALVRDKPRCVCAYVIIAGLFCDIHIIHFVYRISKFCESKSEEVCILCRGSWRRPPPPSENFSVGLLPPPCPFSLRDGGHPEF